MALPNTDFGAGRPATKAETFGTKTGQDTEVVKGLDDIEDVENEGDEDLKRLSGKSVKVHSGNPVNAKNYANNLRGSGSSSRN